MSRTPIEDLEERIGNEVTLCGWVDTLRLLRRMQFVVLRDHTGRAQLVHERAGDADELAGTIDALKPESAVIVRGTVQAAPHVNLRGLEVVVQDVQVANMAEQPLPIDSGSSVDLRSDYRFLDLRRDDAQLVFAVQTTAEDAMRRTARRVGFIELHSPKLMAGASEGGAEVFHVDYFGRQAFLAQSPQFYKQMAIAGGMDRVFEVGPVFRAEPSFTSRHATEFTGVDIEMAWVESVEDVMDVEEEMLVEAISSVHEVHGEEIRKQFGVELTVPERPFPRIRLAEATAAIRKTGWEPALPGRLDLDPEGERRVSRYVTDRTGHDFAFVTEYPASVRPFYHMRPAGNPGSTCSYDLLWNGVEITTGAQREHRYDILVAQAAEKGIDVSDLDFYLDCFRYGCPPHGGFGLGLSRMIMVMLGLRSVRDAMFLFRSPKRLRP